MSSSVPAASSPGPVPAAVPGWVPGARDPEARAHGRSLCPSASWVCSAPGTAGRSVLAPGTSGSPDVPTSRLGALWSGLGVPTRPFWAGHPLLLKTAPRDGLTALWDGDRLPTALSRRLPVPDSVPDSRIGPRRDVLIHPPLAGLRLPHGEHMSPASGTPPRPTSLTRAGSTPLTTPQGLQGAAPLTAVPAALGSHDPGPNLEPGKLHLEAHSTPRICPVVRASDRAGSLKCTRQCFPPSP